MEAVEAAQQQAAALEAARQGGLISMVVTSAGRTLTLVAGAIIMLLVVLCLVLLFAVTYAQVIWAQIAIYILIFIGPIFIPWMVFEPLAFMFWGWFKAMITYSLYGLIAGVVMRVFMGVALGFVTTLNTTTLNWDSLADLGRWLLVVLPLFVPGYWPASRSGRWPRCWSPEAGPPAAGSAESPRRARQRPAAARSWRQAAGKPGRQEA